MKWPQFALPSYFHLSFPPLKFKGYNCEHIFNVTDL